MFKHCALVKILAPETLFDADVSLVLGVVLGLYCTRYLEMYFSSPVGLSLVGESLLDAGVPDDLDDGVEYIDRGVHTDGQADYGVELVTVAVGL